MTDLIRRNDSIPQVNGVYDLTIPQVRQLLDGDMVIARFISELNTPATKRAYVASIYEFFRFLYGDRKLDLNMMVVDPSHAQRYESYIKSKLDNGEYKTSTFNSKIKGIKAFYNWLIAQTTSNVAGFTVFKINPFKEISQKAENDTNGSDPLTPDEIMLMLNNPYGHSPHIKERNTLMFILAIATGIRNDALISITEDNIKKICDDFIIEALDKENKMARMAINPYYDRLMTWYERDKIFNPSENRTIFGITPNTANRIIKEWAESVGLYDKKITFHSLRTTTAVQIFHNNNDNVYKVQEALHHSHIETSHKYLKKENKVNHDGENIIENIINGDEKFNNKIDSLDVDQLRSILKGLSVNDKINILRDLEKKGI